jgi:hydroxymethylbilane synthase
MHDNKSVQLSNHLFLATHPSSSIDDQSSVIGGRSSVVSRRASGVGRRASGVVIGTRKSKLALAQSEMMRAALIEAHPGLAVELELITTKGDMILDRPLSAVGDKGLFVTEIEDAMREGRVDLAVHSAKDLPSELPPDMTLAATPCRADPRDALISRHGLRLIDLPQGARVGTSSLRRACQLRYLRPDLELADLRGNVDTRLRKLHEGQYDAIVLAAAGLLRLNLEHEISEILEPDVMIPAVSQGALGIEARAGDERMAELLATLDDPSTRIAVTAERAFLAQIGGGCQVPVGAYARLNDNTLTLIGMIGSRDKHSHNGTNGSSNGPNAPPVQIVRGHMSGPASDPALLGLRLAEELLANGGQALL